MTEADREAGADRIRNLKYKSAWRDRKERNESKQIVGIGRLLSS